MILCDVKVWNRIDARVPWRDYLYNFKPTLFEGKWYYIQDFRLKRATSIPKYLVYVYEIEFMWHTKMWPISDRSDESSLQFIHADEVESEYEDYGTDAIGVISSVSTVSRFPYVCRQGETDFEARYVTLTLKDNL
ncbi:putative nucleic acid-binding protein [Arabidopsis thaliana]